MGVADESIGKLHYLPIITFILIPVTFFITYAIAVSLRHVPPIFPYISDTGAFPPESCIFAQLINIAATLLCLVAWIRYSQMKELSSSYHLPSSWSKLNMAGLILGIITSLGLSIVGNFQETSVISVHAIGALLCFGCGTFYFCLQAQITYKVNPSGSALKVAHLRFLLALANATFFVCGIIAVAMTGRSFEGEGTTEWYKETKGWQWRLLTAILEWLCAGCFCLQTLTFAYDFRNIKLVRPKVINSVVN